MNQYLEKAFLQSLRKELGGRQGYQESRFLITGDQIVDAEVDESEDRVWAIRPVPVLEFVEDYIGMKTLSKAQLDVLHAIFGDDPEEKFFNVELAILKVGQGGGKNLISTIAMVYTFYLWCCLAVPHKYFNLQYHESFDVLNFSQVSERQARNVFFKELTSMMKNVTDPETGGNWFTQHIGFQVKQFGRGDVKERELRIPSRHPGRGGINVYCLDSEARTVEGYTIFGFILDEPSRANTPVKYARAKHQYQTAYTNSKTRFPMHHRLGIVFAYPEQEVNDLLVELFDKYSVTPAENEQEVVDGVLTAWYDTYVFNPKDQEEKRAQYEKQYKTDPIDADRRWRAIVPPNVFGFFMPHMGKIQDCANPNLPFPVRYKKTLTRRRAKIKGVDRNVDFTALELFDIKGDTKDRRWGGDFAVSKDRLVLAGGYNETLTKPVADLILKDRDRETGKEIEQIIKIGSYPVVDIILIWEPTKNYPIDFLNVEDTIADLFENHFPNSRSIHFDKWNSESIKQRLLDIGIYDCETLTFSNPEQLRYGRVFRHLVWNNACEYPDHPLLKKEMEQIMLLNNVKLDHPTGASKDVWDAVTICINLLIQHAHKGKALDIDMGEGRVEAEGAEARLYETALLKFCNRYDRTPRNHAEMATFMKEEMDIQKSPEEIELMKEAWEIEQPLRELNVLGLNEYGDYMGLAWGTDSLGLDADFGPQIGGLPDPEDIGI